MKSENFVKESVRKMAEYRVPGEDAPVKLNQNESPYDIPLGIKQEITARLNSRAWNRYPPEVPETLIRQISRYTGVEESMILPANSSNELIQSVITAVCNSGDTLLTVTPGFSSFSRMSAALDLNLAEVPLKEDLSFDVEEILQAGQRARMVILASPNNPTGSMLTPEEVEWLAGNLDCPVVIDEAYFEFSGQTVQGLLAGYENLLIIRTFSKALSGAALRLGYMLASADWCREVRKVKMPFSVGLLQQVAGEVLLQKRELFSGAINYILAERERLYEALEGMTDIRPYPTSANFILFKVDGISAGEIFESLSEKGIQLRYFNSPGLENCLRVSVGTKLENDDFLRELRRVLEREKVEVVV